MLLYQETITPGAAGYCPTDALFQARADGWAARTWSLGARLVSLQLTKAHGGGLWKSRDRMLLEDPRAILDTLEGMGVRHPSSFADCYHQLAPSTKPLPYTYNGLFNWWHGGPWSEARRTGEHRGEWRRYDMQSAYRWASTVGLPDPETWRVVRGPRGTRDGLWIVETEEYRPDLPSVFQAPGERVVISTEEIERYNLRCTALRGVVWEKCHPSDYVERTLGKLPVAKQAGRAYWGRWIARDPLVCETPNARWEMRNLHANFIWGWLIVGRVRLRVWEVATEAAHVYVDEVLVPHELPEGTVPGSWRLKEVYADGVHVRRTGWFGPRGDGSTYAMQTGVARP